MKLAATLGCAALGLSSLSGCSSDDPVALSVVVLKRSSDSNGTPCWAQLTDEGLPAEYPRSRELCPNAELPVLSSGVDRVRVVVDYGVALEDAKTAPAPTIKAFFDGAEQATGASVQASVDGNARFALAELVVPVTEAKELRFTVSTPSGYSGAAAEAFTLMPAEPTIEVTECKRQTPCLLEAGVGTAEVVVSAPGASPRDVTLESTLDDVQASEPFALKLTTPSADKMTTRKSVQVPFGRPGAVWRLTARLGSVSHTQEIALAAPAIEAELSSCKTAPCAAKYGSSHVLTIRAPAAMRESQATVSTALDHFPLLPPAKVNLALAGAGKASKEAAYPITAPASGASWQIDVHVAGYAAQSLVVELTPP
jgi:hypothetical protein